MGKVMMHTPGSPTPWWFRCPLCGRASLRYKVQALAVDSLVAHLRSHPNRKTSITTTGTTSVWTTSTNLSTSYDWVLTS